MRILRRNREEIIIIKLLFIKLKIYSLRLTGMRCGTVLELYVFWCVWFRHTFIVHATQSADSKLFYVNVDCGSVDVPNAHTHTPIRIFTKTFEMMRVHIVIRTMFGCVRGRPVVVIVFSFAWVFITSNRLKIHRNLHFLRLLRFSLRDTVQSTVYLTSHAYCN